jgi:hypothetical protein
MQTILTPQTKEPRRAISVNDYDEALHEAIEDLVDQGLLEEGSPAFGVAQQVIHQGYDSLTLWQRAVYDAVVVPALKVRGEMLEHVRVINSN